MEVECCSEQSAADCSFEATETSNHRDDQWADTTHADEVEAKINQYAALEIQLHRQQEWFGNKCHHV